MVGQASITAKYCMYALQRNGGKLSRKELIRETGLSDSGVDRAVSILFRSVAISKYHKIHPGIGKIAIYEVTT